MLDTDINLQTLDTKVKVTTNRKVRLRNCDVKEEYI